MTTDYYDRLAPYYKYIYPDWEGSLLRQAQALDGVIREYLGGQARTILDVACGIGTQSLGLARLGYQVTASDLSPAEVERARQEASRFGVQIDFQVADMRRVWETYRSQFDVLIACDNAVPHLLNNEEILAAFRQFQRCIRPGGACLISVRDYARLERKDGQKLLVPRQVHPTASGQLVLFDLWDFSGDTYEITTYIVEDMGTPEARTHILRGGKYYCVEIPTLERLFREAGFRDVLTLRERFFQPLIIAKK